MCRLLVIKSEVEFPIQGHLEAFANICKNSKEFQGHGWGMAYLKDNVREIYKNICPIWDDRLDRFGSSRFLMVHARSAFMDQGIDIANNMPFFDSNYTFIFNGELRGVRIKADGRIGAEKIFNFIKGFDKGCMMEAFEKGVDIIRKRSDYIRAMNIVLSDMRDVYLCSYFNEDPGYYTMHIKKTDGGFILCSEPYPGDTGWAAIPNQIKLKLLGVI